MLEAPTGESDTDFEVYLKICIVFFLRSCSSEIAMEIPGLIPNWEFAASNITRERRLEVAKIFLRKSRPRPGWLTIEPIRPKNEWAVYFLYLPDGVSNSGHQFTLQRLRDAGHHIMVVCATPTPFMIPADVVDYADALYWKGLSGYDFSAYSAALIEISHKSPGANVLVINDSVFGPFTDLRGTLNATTWDLTGFTASAEIENHIQSYAFMLRDVTPSRMRSLGTVMFPWRALSEVDDVIHVQETRFARVASKTMSVGALWYAGEPPVKNPSLFRPVELINSGFPFLKRSLTGKLQHMQDVEEIQEILYKSGHPIPAHSGRGARDPIRHVSN